MAGPLDSLIHGVRFLYLGAQAKFQRKSLIFDEDQFIVDDDPDVIAGDPEDPTAGATRLRINPVAIGGSVVVRDDIDKSDATTIDTVQGIQGVPLTGYDRGTPPSIGTVPVYNPHALDGAGYAAEKPVRPGEFNVKHYGSKGDGTTDDSAALTTAAGLGAGVLYFPPGTYWIDASVTFPANQVLEFAQGAALKINSDDGSIVVSIGGEVRAAALQQVFIGTGKYLFTHARRVSPGWWGMPMNGSDDDAPAINSAIASTIVGVGHYVVLPPSPESGNCPRLNTPVRVSRPCILEGAAATGQDGGTYMTSAQGVTAVIVETAATSADGGSGSGSTLRHFAIQSSQLTIARWSATTAYTVGTRVTTGSVDPSSDTYSDAVEPRWFLRCQTAGTSGASEPPNPGNRDDILNQGPGSLVPSADVPNSHHPAADIPDGTNGLVWACDLHVGIYAKNLCFVVNVTITGFTNAGFHYQSGIGMNGIAGPGAANGGGMVNSNVEQCGVGIATRGTDVNGAVFISNQIVDSGYNMYGSGGGSPTVKGACAIYEDSDIGCRYFGCVVDTIHKGRAAILTGRMGNSQAHAIGNHIEGHDPSLRQLHVGAPSYWTSFGAEQSFTDNTQGQIDTAFYQSPREYLSGSDTSGVTTSITIGSRSRGGGVGDLTWFSSDTGGQHVLQYGFGGEKIWAIVHAAAHPMLGFTNELHADTPGAASLVLPLGAFWGGDRWFTFPDQGTTESVNVRAGKRKVGDRFLVKQNLTSPLGTNDFGGVAEKVVLADGYEATTWALSGGFGYPFAAGDTRRPTSGNTAHNSRFVCTVGGIGGTTEPTWNTSTIGATTTDGAATWSYLGDAPVYGVTLTEDPSDAKQGVQTTSATANVVAAMYPVKRGTTRVISSVVIATQQSGTGSPDSYFEIRQIVVRNDAGTMTVVKADTQKDGQINASGTAWATNLAIVGEAVVHRVTGDTGKTIKWGTRGGSLAE